MLRLVTLAAVAAAVILAAGCGGGSSSSDSSAGADTTATTVTTDTGSTDTSTETTGTSSGSTDTGNNVAKGCVDFAGAAAKIGQALGAAGSTGASGEDLKAYFAALADKAPGDIKSAFQIFAVAVGKYADAMKGVKLDPGSTPSAADLAKLQVAAKAFNDPKVKAASTKITAWVDSGCKS